MPYSHYFRRAVIEDLKMCKVPVKDDVSFLKLVKHVLYSLVYFPGFACVFLFRINHSWHKKHLPGWKLFNIFRFYLFSSDISCKAEIGPGLRLVHVFNIVIPAEAKIGKNCTILNGVTLGSKSLKDSAIPVVGDNVYIGTGAKLLGGITIGNNVTIGAQSLCNKSVPDNFVAYGVPVQIKENK